MEPAKTSSRIFVYRSVVLQALAQRYSSWRSFCLFKVSKILICTLSIWRMSRSSRKKSCPAESIEVSNKLSRAKAWSRRESTEYFQTFSTDLDRYGTLVCHYVKHRMREIIDMSWISLIRGISAKAMWRGIKWRLGFPLSSRRAGGAGWRVVELINIDYPQRRL